MMKEFVQKSPGYFSGSRITAQLFMLLLLAIYFLLMPACGDGGSSEDEDGDSDSGLFDADEEIEGEVSDGDSDNDNSGEIEADDDIVGDGDVDNENVEQETDAEEAAPLYRVENGRLLDAQGRVILLRGVNFPSGEVAEWTGDKEGADALAITHIARSGFNAIRLVINWDRIEPEPDAYDTAYLDLVQHHVELAAEAGLYIIIDLHQDMYGMGFGLHGAPYWTCDEAYYESFEPIEPWFFNYFSDEVSACFDHLWQTPELQAHHWRAAREVALRVAAIERVLGFDPINEPFPGNADMYSFDGDYLYPFYEGFAETVGEVMPGRIMFIEPAVTFSMTLATNMPEPITAFTPFFFPHYYNSDVEMNHLWDGDDATDRKAIGAMKDAAIQLGAPFGYGEMGGDAATSNLDDYLESFFSILDEEFAASFLWIYNVGGSGGFSLLDGQGGFNANSWAYLRGAPSEIAGQPLSFSYNPRNGDFELQWTADADAGTTEILVPEWIRQAGLTATLDGAAMEPLIDAARSRLTIPGGTGGERSFSWTVNATDGDTETDGKAAETSDSDTENAEAL